MNVFQPPEPIDDLGARTRRLLFVNYEQSPGMPEPARTIYIEGTHALRSDEDILRVPPCSAERLEGARELLLRIERYRRGEAAPCDVHYKSRDVAAEREKERPKA